MLHLPAYQRRKLAGGTRHPSTPHSAVQQPEHTAASDSELVTQ